MLSRTIATWSTVGAVLLLGAGTAWSEAPAGREQRLSYRDAKALVRTARERGGSAGVAGLSRLLERFQLVRGKPQLGGPSQFFDGLPADHPSREPHFHSIEERYGRRFGVAGAMRYMLDSEGWPTGDGFHEVRQLAGTGVMIGKIGGGGKKRETLDLGPLGTIAIKGGGKRWILNPKNGKALSQGFHWIHRDRASGQLIGIERTWTTTGNGPDRRLREEAPLLYLLHPTTLQTLGQLVANESAP